MLHYVTVDRDAVTLEDEHNRRAAEGEAPFLGATAKPMRRPVVLDDPSHHEGADVGLDDRSK